MSLYRRLIHLFTGGCMVVCLSCAGAAHAADPWWRHAVIYEVYPRSFQDTDGDGIGDLAGITRRLDYLQALGVDALWITPMYPSPQVDFGYDIADYEAIDPQFGTSADFDHLVREARARHLRVILDMVLNHTSDKHPWFLAAASARDNPRHEWYVWQDGNRDADGNPRPPNNWVSLFGGSAWEWHPQVRQFYYHEFYKQQPDLNWRNPAVEKAMFDAMRFWLDRGVAGFRLDAITSLYEDPALRDEPTRPGTNLQGDPRVTREYTDNRPENHAVMKRLRRMVDSYAGDRVLIGETYLPHTSDLDQWYGGEAHDELHLPMDMLPGFINRLDARTFRRRLEEAQTELHDAMPLAAFDNHDNVRSWDRYGDGNNNAAIARVVATLLLATRSAAIIYQGQELGQETVPPSRREQVRDPIGITGWPRDKGRDGERTPMQWDSSNAQAGFSSNPATWLPVSPSYRRRNVETESKDPNSLLNWYRQLIALRSRDPRLRDGAMHFVDADSASVLAFLREGGALPPVLVAINMTREPQRFKPSLPSSAVSLAGSTALLETGSTDTHGDVVELAPFGVWIGTLRANH